MIKSNRRMKIYLKIYTNKLNDLKNKRNSKILIFLPHSIPPSLTLFPFSLLFFIWYFFSPLPSFFLSLLYQHVSPHPISLNLSLFPSSLLFSLFPFSFLSSLAVRHCLMHHVAVVLSSHTTGNPSFLVYACLLI